VVSRRIWGRVAIVAILSLLVAACGGGPGGGSGTTTGALRTDVDQADRSAEMRYAMAYSVNSFDPHRSPIATSDSIFMAPIYDRIVTLTRDKDGNVEVGPQLATSWTTAPDGRSVSFVLRSGVTFQDGTPFDGAAVKANIDRAKGPGSTIASVLAMVDSVEVTDATHVTFRLNTPYPGLLYTLATSTNGMMASPAAFDKNLATTPVGSGPWKLVSSQKDADTVYQRWDDSWDSDSALVAKLTISTVADGNARLSGLRTGRFDAINPQGLEAESKALEEDGYQWYNELAPLSFGVLINNTIAPFDDVRVRRAVSMAIDREQVSTALLDGLGPPIAQTFAPGYVGHVSGDDATAPTVDVDAAKALIKEAGAEGKQVTLLAQSNEPFSSLAQVVQQALTGIGLNVTIESHAPNETNATWQKKDKAIWAASIFGEGEPSVNLEKAYLGGQNVGTVPPELKAMADQAMLLPLDSPDRDTAYQAISRWLTENPVHVPLARFYSVTAASEKVINVKDLIKVSIGKIDVRGVGIAKS
jgi:peptide/nickel transport system substrate-binding protein